MLEFGGKTATFWCQCFSIDDTRSFVCFRSCWTSCKVFRIPDKESCASFEDLGRLGGLGGDCSGSLRWPCFDLEWDLEREQWRFLLIADEPEKIFPKREATAYPTNEKTTPKELRLAVIQPKNMKKGGKRTHLPVVVRSTREKMTGSDVSGLYAIAGSYGITSCVPFFLPKGGTALFSVILDALKSGS